MNFVNAGTTKIRTSQYSIPDDLVSYIDLITPTVFLGQATAAVPTSTRKTKRDMTPTTPYVAPACSTSITPACLKEMYNTVSYTPLPAAGSRIGFGIFLDQSAIYSDLFMYEQYNNITQQNITTILVPGSGATNDQNITTAQYGEANLDVGFSLALPYAQADCIQVPNHLGNEPPASSDRIHHRRFCSIHPQS
jgi:tripeptidyl-peptidase-1